MKTELNHNDIVFRVLLQREEFRPHLTFTRLEEALPKPILKSLEEDWRFFIREESLEFDTAFQKAVRKHIPGLHFIILAAEFLGKVPFHVALGYFLLPQKFKGQATFLENEVFKLANKLEEEIQKKRARFIPQRNKVYSPPRIIEQPSGPTRKCYFCGKRIPIAELYEHVDSVHLNPSHLGGVVKQPNIPSVISPTKLELSAQPTPAVVDDTFPFEAGNFRRPRCACGAIAIPGDFYCYSCAPD